jgi:hypothetical protein
MLWKEDLDCCEGFGLFILNFFLSFILPIYFSLCFFIVEPGRAIIFEIFGKPREIYRESGCHFSSSFCCRRLKKVNMAIQYLTLHGSSVPYLHGSLMIVSVTVDYKIVDPL